MRSPRRRGQPGAGARLSLEGAIWKTRGPCSSGGITEGVRILLVGRFSSKPKMEGKGRTGGHEEGQGQLNQPWLASRRRLSRTTPTRNALDLSSARSVASDEQLKLPSPFFTSFRSSLSFPLGCQESQSPSGIPAEDTTRSPYPTVSVARYASNSRRSASRLRPRPSRSSWSFSRAVSCSLSFASRRW